VKINAIVKIIFFPVALPFDVKIPNNQQFFIARVEDKATVIIIFIFLPDVVVKNIFKPSLPVSEAVPDIF
jgi:hypothetical protein